MADSKTVLITGASTGIGRSTAHLFAEKGWNVVATMRNPDAGKELAGMPQVLVARLDVTDESSIKEAVTAATTRFGGLDVLVNNAGYGAYGVLEAMPLESMRRQFETNVLGLLATTKAVIPVFRRQGSGTIVNVSSFGGRLTFPFGALYHGSKFAVEGISEAISYEMRAIGVRVKIVEPGAIKTEFMGNFEFTNDESLEQYQGLVQGMMAATEPMMKNGAPPEVVAEVIYTAATDGSERLRYTAGEDARQSAGDAGCRSRNHPSMREKSMPARACAVTRKAGPDSLTPAIRSLASMERAK